jgi:hypothetical protein
MSIARIKANAAINSFLYGKFIWQATLYAETPR